MSGVSAANTAHQELPDCTDVPVRGKKLEYLGREERERVGKKKGGGGGREKEVWVGSKGVERISKEERRKELGRRE